eukprot:1147739-Pelagomonas_calceolata.AAC.1
MRRSDRVLAMPMWAKTLLPPTGWLTVIPTRGTLVGQVLTGVQLKHLAHTMVVMEGNAVPQSMWPLFFY